MGASELSYVAIAISLVSLLVAALSLGWNVYKEIGLRAQVEVDLYVGLLISPTEPSDARWVIIRCVNKGPGKVKVDGLRFEFRKVLPGGRTETGYALTMYDEQHSHSSPLPVLLDVGETATYLVPFTSDCFLKLDVLRFAVSDTFGRDHWVRSKRLEKARKDYVERFTAVKE